MTLCNVHAPPAWAKTTLRAGLSKMQHQHCLLNARYLTFFQAPLRKHDYASRKYYSNK